MSDFVGLQKRLESNPDLREAASNSLKKSEDGNTAASTAKKPSLGRRLLGGGHQLFGVHQKVIDEGSIEEKQAFLSNWLETLSNHSTIGHSDELKDFYGYEDPLKSPDDNQKKSRLDKTFARKVTGVFNSIKDALPNFEENERDRDQDVSPGSSLAINNAEDSGGGGGATSLNSFFPSLTSSNVHTPIATEAADFPLAASREAVRQEVNIKCIPREKSEFEATLDFHIQHLEPLMSKDETDKTKSLFLSREPANVQSRPVLMKLISEEYASSTTGGGLEDGNDGLEKSRSCELASSLLNLLLVDLPSTSNSSWYTKDITTKLGFAVLGRALEDWIRRILEAETASEDEWSKHVDWLRSALWPQQNGKDVATKIEANPPASSKISFQENGILPRNMKIHEVLQAVTTKLYGCSASDLKSHWLNFTRDRKINEDLVLSLVDLVIAHLMIE